MFFSEVYMKCETSVCCDLQKGIGKHRDFALHIKNTLAVHTENYATTMLFSSSEDFATIVIFFFLPLNNLYSNV